MLYLITSMYFTIYDDSEVDATYSFMTMLYINSYTVRLLWWFRSAEPCYLQAIMSTSHSDMQWVKLNTGILSVVLGWLDYYKVDSSYYLRI